MERVYRTSRAETDLLEVWLHIAADSVAAADRLMEDVKRISDLLADQPGMGQDRSDLAPELRSHPIGNYLLFYRRSGDQVCIVRVVHGARDLPPLFEDDT